MTTEQVKAQEAKQELKQQTKQEKQDSSQEQETTGVSQSNQQGKSNRSEKKFKKAMTKMGLKPVTGINRVTIKKGKGFLISIDDPDVWKSPGSQSTYIVFGKPNMDGLQTGQNEVDQFKNPVEVPVEQKDETKKVQNVSIKKEEKIQEVPAEKQSQEVQDLSEEGLTADNIQMVMNYTHCSKAKAIKVLRQTGDDSVNAILKLTQ